MRGYATKDQAMIAIEEKARKASRIEVCRADDDDRIFVSFDGARSPPGLVGIHNTTEWRGVRLSGPGIMAAWLRTVNPAAEITCEGGGEPIAFADCPSQPSPVDA